MEQGFLNKSNKALKKDGGDPQKKGSLLSNLAKKVKNIDGKVLGKDGSSNDDVVKGLKPLSVANDTIQAVVGITCGEKPILVVNVTENPIGISSLKPTDRLNKQENVADINRAVVIAQDAVDMISARFEYTLYGYFIGKRLAFPAVQSYVNNVWAKYRLERVMLHQGFFLFKFSSREGMESVLKNDPWRIRLVPLILNIWNPKSELVREDIKKVLVWVKMFNVPILTYSDVGLNLITSKLGQLIMLDAHTSNMCLNSYGLSSYARALVEILVDHDLVESLDVAIPLEKGKGHRMVSIVIEFEWKPPRCALCKNFDHVDEEYPKKGKEDVSMKNLDDGIVHVKRKKKAAKPKQIDGIRFTKPKPKFNYMPMSKSNNTRASTSKPKDTSPIFKDDVNGADDKLSNNDSSRPTNTNVLDINIDFGSNSVAENHNSSTKDSTSAKEVIDDGKVQEKGSLWERFKEAKKISTSKPKSSLLDIEDESDEDEVYMPNDNMSKYISSSGGEFTMEDDDLDFYDGYEAQIYDLPKKVQAFCDQYDIR
ncbi:zinc knuckle CX2CX4HX4C containing protein [Tanacetum coccineum]|uniref:Zinc knuckle CX2CX4HX4C containing protein n=1 Tax=Tanacetum coccineum TaxID=301880 RepID=A0ABQ4YDW4_9ASTR